MEKIKIFMVIGVNFPVKFMATNIDSISEWDVNFMCRVFRVCIYISSCL